MRTLFYAFTLCSLLVLTSGCILTGIDGSHLGRHYQTGHTVFVEATVYGEISGGGTDWSWGEVSVKGCDTKVNQLNERCEGGGCLPDNFFVDGVFNANLGLNPALSAVRDDSGDGFTSGWVNTFNGIGFFSTAPCVGVFFDDTVRFKRAYPGTGALSCMATGTLLNGFMSSGRRANDNAGGMARLSLEERITILNSIDLENDLVDLNGESYIKVNLTEITVNGDTFRPEGVGMLWSDSFDRALLDRSAPGVKPYFSWLAGQLQISLDAGVDPEITATINDNITLSYADVMALMADKGTVTTGIGQGYVDGLREFAGSDITGTDLNSRSGRR
jgi:hypothetical protein